MVMYLCVSGIDFASFDDLCIRLLEMFRQRGVFCFSIRLLEMFRQRGMLCFFISFLRFSSTFFCVVLTPSLFVFSSFLCVLL